MSDPWQPVGGQPPSTPPPPPGQGGYPQAGGYPQPGPPGSGPGGYQSPPGGFPPAPGGPGFAPPGAGQGYDGFAIAALVLGILSCIPLGIIFGIIALNRIGKSQQKGRGLAIGGIVASVLWGLAVAVLVVADDSAERDDEGNITESGEAGVFDLQVGDCWNDPTEATELESVDAVPCEEAHDAEVYAEFDMADADTYPGVDVAQQQAEQGCFDRFEGFVGIAPASTTLEVFYLYPTQDSWDRLDDRQISCIVSDPAGPTTGTLEGAAR